MKNNNFPKPIFLPPLSEFYAHVQEVLNLFHKDLGQYINSISIKVENFPHPDLLASLKIKNRYDLLGLYQGVPIKKRPYHSNTKQTDTIFLYRCPIINHSHKIKEEIEVLIQKIIMQEIFYHSK